MEKFIAWLEDELERVNKIIEMGKGTWPNENYIKDEDWARLMARKHALDDVRYQIAELVTASE